ncbi:MAG: YdcF family protein [Bacteroidia bacterium]|nr:YdcF family protein [Bacteroidia bacterium]
MTKEPVHRIIPRLKKIIKYIIFVFGIMFILLSALAFTSVPFYVQWWLGTSENKYTFTPDYIVMLGAGGMPEGENLIRLFYTIQAARTYPESNLILAQSIDTAVSNYMRTELIHHNIDSSRIYIESNGTNTRGQALAVSVDYYDILNKKVLLVTSPLHMKRAVKVFRRLGFRNVGGESSFAQSVFPDLTYNHLKIGGKRYLPDVSASLKIRYNFWNYFSIEISCLREFSAMFYYKLNGWI